MSRITFYFIRHGESKGNKEGLFRGRTDFPLTELGKKQAQSLARALKGIRFSAIISSPLKRAYETALFVANGQVVRIMDEFNNINLAEWEGKRKEYIQKKYPREWHLWITEPEKLQIAGAETLDEVKERAKRGVLNLIKEYRDGTFCIVTHRAVLKPLFAELLGIKKPYFWRLHFDTASYSIIEYDDKRGFTLMKLNVTHHLPEFEVERF